MIRDKVLTRKLPGYANPVNWAYAHTKKDGEPFDHRNSPYTIEPLMESAMAMQQSEGERGIQLTVLKGRQAGLTAAMNTFGLWHLDMHGGTVIHAVPQIIHVENIHDALMDRVREAKFENLKVPKINPFQPESRRRFSMKLKEFEGRPEARYYTMHTVAGNEKNPGGAARGKTSQVVFYDERATMPQKAISVIKQTTIRTQTPILWNVGSAGETGDDLDTLFRSGTMAEWAIPCDLCGKHTVLMPYGSNIADLDGIIETDGTHYFYACEHCRAELNVLAGHWEHEKESGMPSYHAPSMIAPWYDAHRLMDDMNDPNHDEQSIAREVVGLPHSGDAIVIAPNEIITMDFPEKGAREVTIMAVDWGKVPGTSWCVIRGTAERMWVVDQGIVKGEHDDHVPQLVEIAKKWEPHAIMADFWYEGGRIEKLHRETGRVWSCLTNLSPSTQGGMRFQIQKDYKKRAYNCQKRWLWEHTVGLLKDRVIVLAPHPLAQKMREDIVNVHPKMTNRGEGAALTYDSTHQHLATCLMMAAAFYLRDKHRTSRAKRVGHGNPLKPSTLRG